MSSTYLRLAVICFVIWSTAGFHLRAADLQTGALNSEQRHEQTDDATKRALESLRGLDQQLKQALSDLPYIPGMAVGILHGGDVIYKEGFGYRDVAKQLPFTTATPSYIASVTKSFTGFLALQQSRSGVVPLEARVAELLPGLITTRTEHAWKEIRIRDLVNHQTGLRNDPLDFAFSYTGHVPDEDEVAVFRTSQQTEKKFRYTNLGYQLYALALEKNAGLDWRAGIEEGILRPLEMDTTTFDFEDHVTTDLARPYMASDSGFVEIPMIKRANTMHAAGGMVSTVDDLLRWLEVHLDGGKWNSRRVFSTSAIESAHRPVAQIESSYWGYFQRTGYSYGWYTGIYREKKLVHCFGSFPGYRAHLSFMPELNVGIVMLSNESRDGGFLPEVLALGIYDRILGVDDRDQVFQQRVKQYREMVESRFRPGRNNLDFSQPVPLPEVLELQRYVGEYQHADYGALRIESRADSLLASWGNLRSFLAFVEEYQFMADFSPSSWTQFQLTFDLRESAEPVLEVSMNGKQIVFKKTN